MRGTTLGVLLQMLRRELRVAESTALGKNVRESYAHALRSAQDRIYDEWPWPNKNIRRDVTLQAGSRYYAIPEDLSMENIEEVQILYSGQWTQIRRGITEADYNAINPETNSRTDPVEAWDFFLDPDGGDMIEVWPLPASNGGIVRFKGQHNVPPLLADADRCFMDDLSIVLQAASDLTPIKERRAAQEKADRRIFSQRANLSSGQTFVSGGGANPRHGEGRPPRIVITPARTGG